MMPSIRAVRSVRLAGFLLLVLACTHLRADDGTVPANHGYYANVFGGGGGLIVDHVSQVGTALYGEKKGGPLSVNATGSLDSRGFGLVGGNIGIDITRSCFDAEGGFRNVRFAVEFEAFYFGGTQSANLNNPTPRLPAHNFVVTMPMDNAVLLTNAVFSLKTQYENLTPYVGLGVGTAAITMHGANSAQIAPAEPGINHFNSSPDSSCWGFAAQTKVGLQVQLTDRCYLFSEYRFLYIGSTTYTFGSTQYPIHIATTPWTVHLGDMFNHIGVGGIGFRF